MPVYPATVVAGKTSLLADPGDLGEVVLPLGLMAEAVAGCGCRERRRRLLPALAVMVFVLGCCLFYGEGYGEVARKLAGWLPIFRPFAEFCRAIYLKIRWRGIFQWLGRAASIVKFPNETGGFPI